MKQILLRHFPSPTPLPTGGSTEVIWGEPQQVIPTRMQTCARLQAPQWDVRAKAPYWILKVPFSPCSQPRPLLSLHLVALAVWGELYCPPATLQECSEVQEIISIKHRANHALLWN